MLLNKRNSNGSINLIQVTGENKGELISPFHKEFRSQIEDGIWPIVSALVDRGFYVVDSCEGHWDRVTDDYSHFTVAFPSVESAINFTSLIFVSGIEFSIHDSWITVDNEVEFINKMFMTSHTNFVFVSIKILPSKSKLIKRLFTWLVRYRILRKIKRRRYEHLN